MEDQYNLVRELSQKEYTKVYWIIDLDTVLKEEREASKGGKSPVKTFEEYRADLSKNYKNVGVIVNNPCLEFWFLLHFEKTTKQFNDCSGVETQLKKHIKDYTKTQRLLKKIDFIEVRSRTIQLH